MTKHWLEPSFSSGEPRAKSARCSMYGSTVSAGDWPPSPVVASKTRSPSFGIRLSVGLSYQRPLSISSNGMRRADRVCKRIALRTSEEVTPFDPIGHLMGRRFVREVLSKRAFCDLRHDERPQDSVGRL